MSLDLSPLQNAVSQLEEALDLYGSELAEGDPRLKRHLRAAVIQAFEFTYELSFKMLKRLPGIRLPPIPRRSMTCLSTM